MKNYDNTLTIEATPKAYKVLYNNSDCILFTDSLNKAIKMAQECAKCATQPCSYEIYVSSNEAYITEPDVQIMKLTVK